MRTLVLVLAALLPLAAGAALAHPRGVCDESRDTSLVVPDFHLHRFHGSCSGIVVGNSDDTYCGGADLHAEGVHLLLAAEEGCDVGVLVERPLLP